MSTNTRAVVAVILASLVGSAIFVALLPLGDACSFNDPPGVNCALQSPIEEFLWNALAVLIPIVVGAGAALAAGSHRHTVGLIAAPLAIVGANFGARLLYALEASNFRLFPVIAILATAAVLGLVGGHLSAYVVPRDKRMQRAGSA